MTKRDGTLLQIRFKGGATRTLKLPPPVPIGEFRLTDPALVKEIDRLLDHYNDTGVGKNLSKRGFTTCEGKILNSLSVGRIRIKYKLKNRFSRLRESGLLTAKELGILLIAKPATIRFWMHKGFLIGHPFNSKGENLFEMPDEKMREKLTARLHIAGQGYQQPQRNVSQEV